MMKKLLYSILAIAALAGAMSCQRELKNDSMGDTVDVTFRLGLEGLQTKAFSDGTTATTLDVLVYNVRTSQGTVHLPDLDLTKANAFTNLSADVTLSLARGERYQIVFWAHAPESAYTLDKDNATITVSAGAANDELRDGFLGVYDATISEAVAPNVILRRPFAQINILTTKADWDNAVANGLVFTGSSMTVTAPTKLNLISGEVSDAQEQVFSMAPITAAVNIPDFESNYKYIAMNYVLADANTALIGEASHPFTFEVFREGQENYVFQHSMVSVPVQRNYRTIIVGEVFCTSAAFDVTVVPEYDGNMNPDNNTQTIATITASDISVEEGKTAYVSASTNSSAAITYTSNDGSIATVSADGVVTGVKAGSTTVTLSVAAVEGEFTAATKTITVTVTAAAVTPSDPPATDVININGDMSDWDDFAALASTGTSRIRSWKFTSDDNKLYFYFVLRKNKMRTEFPISLAFNWDESGTYTADNMTDCELVVKFQPFTNTTAGTPACVNGTINTAAINGSDVSDVAIKAFGLDPDSTATGDTADYYLEVSIPRSVLPNLPAKGTAITAGAGFEWYNTSLQSITL